MLCLSVAAATYFGWVQFGAYQQRQQARDFADIDKERRVALLEVDGCQARVDLLLSMTDRLLKAGGMLVPLDIGRDIELCLARGIMSASGLAEMERTKLIRLFPVND
ncbi:hypothetical protein GGE16_001095 [Rhizobium leguminosarum]|uniref:Uncharacterized protein n=1 Tax=Rhizobium leguminosarum TaxID=384 RepID=A0AAE2SW36_RHILE|nr:hypothetical protein [Rhizobium leguminosarum]MBB4433044.1 hypothetical protein [Rhizobium esperanzae]MBB4289079.1 hypothetical protein [Rhizobium leguminosarum]MBB4294828.1 hypothetical protein [Rhizobium leguminosarum]MBB4306221.1 hypothetical protein [Rhizobium leguminosarum]MBB4527379.1 hypothetical protein [Rhizobium leguminosarum]